MIAIIVAALYSFHIDSYNQLRLFNDLFSETMGLISCSNIGCRKNFNYRVEKKCHLESEKCADVSIDPVNYLKTIFKKDGGNFVCLEHVILKLHAEATSKDIRNSVKIETNLSRHFNVEPVTKFSCTSQNLKDTSIFM